MLYWLDLFGVFVFAISGALAADRRGMDLFGFVAIALLPAIGGGTVRDMVLDAPVFWVQDPIYLWLILAAGLMTFFAAPLIQRVERALLWADAVGLSVFCVAGAAKALTLSGSATVAVAMGVVTAVLGGIIRDVVCNEIPLVLRQDIYATAAFSGAAAYVALLALGVANLPALWLAAATCFAVRGSAIVWGWSLPKRGVT
ncbi:MAG: trimeric intracellular cation channel family protein [Pseudomonadales bacterium]